MLVGLSEGAHVLRSVGLFEEKAQNGIDRIRQRPSVSLLELPGMSYKWGRGRASSRD